MPYGMETENKQQQQQHIQEIIIQFDITLNHFGPMVFVSNQENFIPNI